MRRRCHIGRDVRVVDESEAAVCLEGRVRLRPGSMVDVVGTETRPAVVGPWMVARLGRDGTVYRGWCHWDPPGGEDRGASARKRS